MKEEAPSPARFAQLVAHELAVAQKTGGFQTARGLLRTPIQVAPIVVRDGVTCPACGEKKLVRRPHQADQTFCFGCGRIDR